MPSPSPGALATGMLSVGSLVIKLAARTLVSWGFLVFKWVTQ